MKLQPIFDSVKSDFLTIMKESNYVMKDNPENDIKNGFYLLDILCRNRSYDDKHPAFASGHWKRVLPFDGRKYCFYYDIDNANDSHVETLIKSVMKSIRSK